jgi:thymidylate synthase
VRVYKEMAAAVLTAGKPRADRTGIGRRSIFGYQLRHHLSDGFPLLTTKKIHWRSVVHELLWFISGDTNIRYLKEHGVRIWDEWADANGDLGPVYGKQWRRWSTPGGETIDQLRAVIDAVKSQPNSSRLIVNSWNVGEVAAMALPPCHTMFQLFVEDGALSLHLYQRSADVFLGVPFNIASYGLLLLLIANECHLKPGTLVWTGGDVHIYENHVTQVQTQLSREELPLPTVRLRVPAGTPVDAVRFSDIELLDYQSHPAIKGVVAV